MVRSYVITASKLRQDVYKILDHLIETGEPVLILRKGVKLKIVKEPEPMSKLDRLKAMATPEIWIGRDPEDIFHYDNMKEWREEWGISDEEWFARYPDAGRIPPR